MTGLLDALGAPNVMAIAAVALGLVVLVLAIRAATNAAIALRARVTALLTGTAMIGVGVGHPLGLDRAIPEQLTALFAEVFDTPLEQAAVIAAAVVLVALIVALFLFYLWVRAMIRLAWITFVGLSILTLAGAVVLAGEGILPVPDALRDSMVLAAIAAMLVVLWGIVRMLQRPTAKV